MEYTPKAGVSGPPHISVVVLRAGTRYRSVEGDRLSEYRLLEGDVDVRVGRLAEPGEVGLYLLGPRVLLVAHEDEVRGARTRA